MLNISIVPEEKILKEMFQLKKKKKQTQEQPQKDSLIEQRYIFMLKKVP